jgi:hypothetical protein
VFIVVTFHSDLGIAFMIVLLLGIISVYRYLNWAAFMLRILKTAQPFGEVLQHSKLDAMMPAVRAVPIRVLEGLPPDSAV